MGSRQLGRVHSHQWRGVQMLCLGRYPIQEVMWPGDLLLSFGQASGHISEALEGAVHIRAP